jgi:hypothetical protein
MRRGCDCGLCRLVMRRDIEAVFDRDRVWLGMFQVRARLNVELGDSGGPDWKLFQSVLAEMIDHGLLIYSFSPKHDQFPRYLLSRLINRGD